MGTYKEDLHSNYQKSVQAFIRVYPHILPDTVTLIDNYCRTCAMYLWNSFSIDINVCTECINVIFAEDDKKRTFTVNQVKAAMAKLSEKKYYLPVPAFFKKIIENDLKDGTNYSRKLASCFGLIFLSFALIDGTVEYEEAKMITKLHGDLVKACDDHHIIAYDDNIDPFEFVDDFEDGVMPILSAAPKAASVPTNTESKGKRGEGNLLSSNKKSAFDELSQLIGLSSAKNEIKELSDFAKVQKARKARGLPVSGISYHLVFTGNPGTGKTTVARLVAQIYKDLVFCQKDTL